LIYEASVPVHQKTLEIRTPGRGFVDLSSQVETVVSESGVRTGLCVVFVQHTSASLVIQENADPAVLRDLERWLSEIAPESRRWEHDDEGPDDMPAHARSALTRTSEAVPISDGRLALGTWQAIYLWEHRARPHSRRVVVHVSGDR
jgi:secondary thiamine-phosphate synthase enzyme